MKKVKLGLLLVAVGMAFATGCEDEVREPAKDTTEDSGPEKKSKYTEREQGIIDAVKAGGVVERKPTFKRVETISRDELGEEAHHIYLEPESHPALKNPMYLRKIESKQRVHWEYSTDEHFPKVGGWSHSIYPGMLMKGSLLSEPLSAELKIPGRAKVPLFLQAINEGGNLDDSEPLAVVAPTQEEIYDAHEKGRERLLGRGPTRDVDYRVLPVYSPADFVMKVSEFGLNGPGAESQITSMWDESKNHVVVILRQVLYSLSIPSFSRPPLGAFGESLEGAELAQHVQAGEPLTYVQSVSYGNTWIILYESDKLPMNLEPVIHARYFNWLQEGKEAEIHRDFGEYTIYAFRYNSGELKLHESLSQSALQEKIAESGVYSESNRGYPVSFRALNLLDNSIAPAHHSREYDILKRDYRYVESKRHAPDARFDTHGIRILGMGKDGRLLLSDTKVRYTVLDLESRYGESISLMAPNWGKQTSFYKQSCAFWAGANTDPNSNPHNESKGLKFMLNLGITPSTYSDGKKVMGKEAGIDIEFTIELDKASGTYKPVGENREYFTDNGGLIELKDSYYRIWLDWGLWMDYVRMEEIIE
ncbi:MAG: hypothetical protein CSA07_00245 [Bacteroidia bacterium]|nr:MAG: hypothetical protein CSA07_00245 [Bacteroidia bacterium]